jgi:energy-coupling factor transport system substrate-specific component
VSAGTLRVVVALVVLVIVTALGVLFFGNFGAEPDPETFINEPGALSFGLIFAVAGVAAFLAYAGVEYMQTGGIASIARQFDTRTMVLIPFAIALNILLGQAVGAALKIPVYLDSIGTILVGALAGPVAGAATGFLANMLWTFVVPPPFNSSVAAAFAIVAAAIGVLAGIFGRAGWLRPRPNRSTRELGIAAVVSIGLIVGLSILGFLGYQAIIGDVALAPETGDLVFLILGWLALVLVVGTVAGLLAMLFVRRDSTAAYVVVAGVVTGIVAAVISAPIAANVFGGVTGAGTDFLVAAFLQGGADIGAATLGQGLISDPIDKVVTFFVVYILLVAMARRTKARFPQGERLLPAEKVVEGSSS